MMHKKNLVAAIKVDGRVLRESSDRVELPFGSEYTILLKNLDTVRQQVKIEIDGKKAVDWIVLDPGQNVNLERFLNDGNLQKGNKFKFIERTAAVEQHRGIEAEDGLIRIEFKRERKIQLTDDSHKVIHHHHYDYYHPYQRTFYNTGSGLIGGGFNSSTSGSLTRSASSKGPSGSSLQGAQNMQQAATLNFCSSDAGAEPIVAMAAMSAPQNEAGITVAGSLSDQKFHTVSDFTCEASEVIVLHLVGKINEKPVKVVKTTNIKTACPTCGRKNKSNSKFCSGCGTGLETV